VSGGTYRGGSPFVALLLPLRFAAPRIPTALVVVAGAVGVSWWLDLEARGVAASSATSRAARRVSRLRERLREGGFEATGETAFSPTVRDAVQDQSRP
jgi:hypothetical protein